MCGFGIRGIHRDHLARPPSRPVAILSDLITFAQNTPVGSSKVPFAQRPPSDPWSPFMSLSLMNSCTQSPPVRILEVPLSNYFAQRPLSDPRNPFRPDPFVGSSKSHVSVSPKDPRRIVEVPFSTYCDQRAPVGSSKSPSQLRPETLPSDPRSPFRPETLRRILEVPFSNHLII